MRSGRLTMPLWMRVGTAALGGILLCAVGCTRTNPTAPAMPKVRITGSPLAANLAEEYARTIPGVQFSVIPGGPIESLATLKRGEAEVAIAFADALYLTYVSDAGQSSLRAISSLTDQPLFLLVGRNSGITKVSGLRGHSVRTRTDNPGQNDPRFPPVFQVPFPDPRRTQSAGDEPRSVSEVVLAAFDIKLHEVMSVTALPNDALARLQAGTLDALFATTTFSQFREALDGGARVIAIDGPSVERLRREYPLIRRVRVAAGTLPGQTAPVNTVGVNMVLVCRSDLDSTLVYRLARTYVENITRLAESEPLLKTARLEDAPVTPIPLHEGAARFYRQWEMMR